MTCRPPAAGNYRQKGLRALSYRFETGKRSRQSKGGKRSPQLPFDEDHKDTKRDLPRARARKQKKLNHNNNLLPHIV